MSIEIRNGEQDGQTTATHVLKSVCDTQQAERAFRVRALTGFGTVTDVREGMVTLFNDAPLLLDYVTVRFRTGHGQQFDVVCAQGCAPGVVRAGDTVTVFYDPDNPTRAVVEQDRLF